MEVPADPGGGPLLPGSGPISLQPERTALWALVWPPVRQDADHQEDHPVRQLFRDYWWGHVNHYQVHSRLCVKIKIKKLSLSLEIFLTFQSIQFYLYSS